MNKTELIDAIAADSGLTKVDAKKAVDSFMAVTTKQLATGGQVALTGYGTFGHRIRPSRTGRNPQNGEPVQVGAKVIATFKAGSDLRSAVNDPKSKTGKAAAKL